ncbi:hypothetical protein EGT74_19670 [Chitinophaga lutea]|uniref:DUF6644 domain-containing protein n=1 Tax=Chitinophaga lutea TaxID=2488634 RepID=A0A3N4PKL6_9BACT|nr:DUF6644 family protein [Chitinophaga lutea]RPE09223.1 hypothetical protein EGT74_19670 [Chitinophaga lutea]
MAVADWLQWLENTPLAVHIRQAAWLYPVIEIIHIVGIVLLVGPALLFDFRLLGFAKHLPVAGLAKHLLSWSRRGLWLIIPSGILLFMTNAHTLGYDPVFRTKLILLVLAACNAWLFAVFRSRWHNSTEMPIPAKAIAVCSIMLWIAIIACGRLLAY